MSPVHISMKARTQLLVLRGQKSVGYFSQMLSFTCTDFILTGAWGLGGRGDNTWECSAIFLHNWGGTIIMGSVSLPIQKKITTKVGVCIFSATPLSSQLKVYKIVGKLSCSTEEFCGLGGKQCQSLLWGDLTSCFWRHWKVSAGCSVTTPIIFYLSAVLAV